MKTSELFKNLKIKIYHEINCKISKASRNTLNDEFKGKMTDRSYNLYFLVMTSISQKQPKPRLSKARRRPGYRNPILPKGARHQKGAHLKKERH